MFVHELPWSVVDPTGRSFDPTPARQIATALITPATGTRAIDRRALEAAIDHALAAAYGAWVSGWTWSPTEPGNGGPVRGWCCADHSLRRDRRGAVEASIEAVVAALTDWWRILGVLAARFDELHAATANLPADRAIEHAAAALLPDVIAWTGTQDAWHRTFETILGWYLEAGGWDPLQTRPAVRAVIDGRFASWCEPDEAAARAACAALGDAVAAIADLGVHDAIDAWRRIRGSAFAIGLVEPSAAPVVDDGHLRYLRTIDRPRDPARADRFGAALAAVRASALAGEPLTLARLAAWQAIVLGVEDAAVRTTDAYARAGRVRYAAMDDLARVVAAAIAEANSDEPVAIRAARVYLDLCFYHPFADGNARAARLALDHVLTRAGRALHQAEPIFAIARAADDRGGAAGFAQAIHRLSGPRTS
ncbi:MAG: Fic family protein [Deltaproteobacteria bacterium]|nr:Fic family protein [Deltaproteobacteria bacterium]